MRILKGFMLVIILLVCTGCDAQFDLEVSKNTIKEKLTIKNNQNEYVEITDYQKKSPLYVNYGEKKYNPYIEGIQDNIDYYDYTNDDNLLTVSYEKSFNSINKALNSNIINSCFEEYKIVVNNDELHFLTSEGLTCFRDELTKLVINVKSDYNVMYSNADRVTENILSWDIDATNYNSKKIIIDYDSNIDKDNSSNNNDSDENKENNKNDKNDEDKSVDSKSIMICIFGSITFMMLIIGYFIYQRYK